jgi:hypothetical protein
MRAAHQLLEPPRILEDPVAELLTPAVAQQRFFSGSSLPTPRRMTIVAAVR